MSEHDLPYNGGESMFEALEILLDIPGIEPSVGDGCFTYCLQHGEVSEFYKRFASGPLATLVPLPEQEIANVISGSNNTQIETLRAKEVPDYATIKFHPSVIEPWVGATFIYCFECDNDEEGYLVAIAVGVEVDEEAGETIFRETLFTYPTGCERVPEIAVDVRYEGNEDSEKFMLDIARDLAKGSLNEGQL